MSRDVACRVSMFATTYKTFNINSLSNQTVEGVSKFRYTLILYPAARNAKNQTKKSNKALTFTSQGFAMS